MNLRQTICSLLDRLAEEDLTREERQKIEQELDENLYLSKERNSDE